MSDVIDIGKKYRVCNLCKGRYCAHKVSIFSVLSEEQLTKLTEKIAHKNYKKGQIIFFEGDISDKLYVINKGKIKIFKYTREGKEQILYILSEGDFVGDLSLLKKDEFKFNAEALEDANICVLTKDDFDGILKESPEIAISILQVVYDRIVKLENLIQSLSTKDIEARIAGLLLSFIKDFGVRKGDSIELELPLSREDIANYIGVTRETISRKLGSMQDQGVIELIGSKKIIIKDIEELEYMAT
ncbi:Crp/Fnr family transcriptional regulator [Proteiniborus sp. MB09-C3]|uniref:Crp/Fnr family transcriptional regulator n=1 Tax=Proteiniborus sp. MB09-C3 TaxID=3050072 RepID=UPI0025527A87|nr:Crp/Fnr family transcriptional regulator [Proteiniborus sp. MB09-C3]WIV12295.1 Crp/Fnr family transcriptional regulator [Proteiniborus sp. MB09-C3]